MSEALKPSLFQEFRETTYWILEGSEPISLRVGQPVPPGLVQVVGGPGVPWAMLTSCNPLSQAQDTGTNQKLFAAMRQDLLDRGLNQLAGVGVGATHGWLEPMMLVWPLGFSEAMDLAKGYRQAGLVCPENGDSGLTGVAMTGLT